MKKIVDILVGAIIKRISYGRPDGVAVVAEDKDLPSRHARRACVDRLRVAIAPQRLSGHRVDRQNRRPLGAGAPTPEEPLRF